MPINPKRGEIWNVNFEPQVGAEIKKFRPALVLDHGHPSLALRIVVPITGWQPTFENNPAKVKLVVNAQNKLDKDSAADAYQVKSVDLSRFTQKIGDLSEPLTDDVANAVALLIDATL